MRTRASRIESVDILRGLCAIGVMLYHYTGWLNLDLPALFDAGLKKVGIYGVEAFFVISGFSLYYSQTRSTSLPMRIHEVRGYLGKRFLRLAPLFAVATIIEIWFQIVQAGYTLPSWLTFRRIIENLLLVFGLTGTGSIVTGGWSIGVEVACYLAFPIAAHLLVNRPRIFAAVVVASLGIMMAWQGFFGAKWGKYVNPLNHGFFFLCGMALGAMRLRRPHLRQMPFAVSIGVLLLALTFIEPSLASWNEIAVGTNRLLFSLLTVTLVGAVAYCDMPAGTWRRVLIFLGTISYSVYLVHPLIFTAERLYVGFSNPMTVVLFCIVATLAVSTATYYFIEQPSMRLYRSKGSKMLTPRAETY